MTKAHVMTIGDELLIGQITDTNSAWLGNQLNQIGVWVHSKSAVGDTKEGIIEGLEYALSKSDIVIITGGLGPTKDDITKHTLCQYFDGELVLNEEVLHHVEYIFKKLNRPMIERNRLQAMVPDNCTVLHNKLGTAPGMWFDHKGKIIVSLPGVPFEMKGIMENEVIPKLKATILTTPVLHKSFLTIGIGESFLAEILKDFEETIPSFIKLAYLPHLSQVRLRLTATGMPGEMMQKELDTLSINLRVLIKDFLAGEDDEPIEKIISNIFIEHNLKLGLAESCTGGYIAHRFTEHAGASKFFEGSLITYSYDAKEKILGVPFELLNYYGAVSEECVTAMAISCCQKLNTDYSIAVSGIAGPTGGTQDKPVGTVWIAVSNGQRTHAQKYTFFRNRTLNIESTFISALIQLFKMLQADLG